MTISNTMLRESAWWLTLAGFAATAYVQTVAHHIQTLSGIRPTDNLTTYRYFFGGPPWIPWIMFRWGDVIFALGLLTLFMMFGWKAGVESTCTVVAPPFLLWQVSKFHAHHMIQNLLKSVPEE